MPIAESHDCSTPHSLTHLTVVIGYQLSHNNNNKIWSIYGRLGLKTFTWTEKLKISQCLIINRTISSCCYHSRKFLYASATAEVRLRPNRTEGETDAPPLSQTAPSKANGVRFRRRRDVVSNVWHLLQPLLMTWWVRNLKCQVTSWRIFFSSSFPIFVLFFRWWTVTCAVRRCPEGSKPDR